MYKRLMMRNDPVFIFAMILGILLIFSGLEFPIVSASGTITVTAPNAGKNWQRGTTKTITWESNGSVGSTVDIELYKDGAYESTIANGTSNDGSHSWNIPTNLDPGLNYTIKITSCSDPLIFDFSDSYLSIGLDKLNFAGYTWYVRDTHDVTEGPGPNYFSSSPENVWLDSEDHLHLKITFRNGNWYCGEIYSEESLGYGIYTFFTKSRVDIIDMNSVYGLFTYMDTNNEIDIEFSRWGWEDGTNAGYTCQPWQIEGNSHDFDMVLTDDYSTHSFNWQSDYIQFRSLYGHYYEPPTQDYVIQAWNYTGFDIPSESTEKVHINLWLMDGLPPLDGQEVEAVISEFNFTNLSNATPPDPQDIPAPPQNLNVELYPPANLSDVRLIWNASCDDGAGDMDVANYVIYRAANIMGPYYHLTNIPATGSPSYTYIDSGTGDGDLSNYFYKVHTIDNLGVEEKNTNRVAKWTTLLQAGWNIFSIPVMQTNSARSSVLATIEGNYRSIQGYDAGKPHPWLHWHRGKPDHMNCLKNILCGKGYYIDMETEDHLVTVGQVPDGLEMELNRGWNLIGNPYTTTFWSQDASIPLEVDLVGYYNISASNNDFKRYFPQGDLGDPIQLISGKGYWFHGKADMTWTSSNKVYEQPESLNYEPIEDWWNEIVQIGVNRWGITDPYFIAALVKIESWFDPSCFNAEEKEAYENGEPTWHGEYYGKGLLQVTGPWIAGVPLPNSTDWEYNMPSTAIYEEAPVLLDAYNGSQNLNRACWYLKSLMDYYDCDQYKVASAYRYGWQDVDEGYVDPFDNPYITEAFTYKQGYLDNVGLSEAEYPNN